MFSFGSNKMATITSNNVQYISSLPKEEGRPVLARALGLSNYEEGKDMQESMRLDFLFDSLNYAVDKGFPWNKVTHVVQFADKLLQRIKDCDKITDILDLYNSQASRLLQSLGEREYNIFSSFVFETVLPHFKLYHTVFTTPRKEQIPKHPITVETPFNSMTLKQSKSLKVWEYEAQIDELEQKDKERVKERLTDREQKLSKLEADSANALKKAVQVETPLDKETIGGIIDEVMKQYTLAATEGIKLNIDKLQEDLEFKLEKTSIPRPQALGPPPRYNVQSIKVPSALNAKSPKPGSRASQRSKKK